MKKFIIIKYTIKVHLIAKNYFFLAFFIKSNGLITPFFNS